MARKAAKKTGAPNPRPRTAAPSPSKASPPAKARAKSEIAPNKSLAELNTYDAKRHFSVTPEPGPVRQRTAKGNLYIIQKHAASHLHYDFRLEHDGVLKSWAVPKGPSLNPADRSLAVQVEDHPVGYGSFEGIIPAGEYGGGTVMLWDRGTWEPEGDATEGLRSGKLKFTLHGEKLRGRWMLVRMHAREGDRRTNWLLRKESDDEAREKATDDVRVTLDRSIATGRSMDEIAEQKDRVWGQPESKKYRTTAAKATAARASSERKRTPAAAPAKPRNAPRAPSAAKSSEDAAPGAPTTFPSHPKAQLATLFDDAPQGNEWVHEVKFDGYRVLGLLRAGDVTLLTRRGNDWTSTFAPIAAALAKLPADTAVVDGEVVVLNPEGKSDFQALQNALKDGKGRATLRCFLFDLLYLNGRDTTRLPLLNRKKLLHKLLAKAKPNSILQYSEHIVGGGGRVFTDACKLTLEGIISKRADSLYTPKRTNDWRKVKCINRQEFVIGGYSDPEGSRAAFGALLLGVYEGDKLHYCGKVGTGFTAASLREIHRKLTPLHTSKAPFINPPRGFEARGVHWLRPELVAEVVFSEWTGDNHLRHPSFQGLREDKDAKQVVRERREHDADGTPEKIPMKADVPPEKPKRTPGFTPGGRSKKGRAPVTTNSDPLPAAGRDGEVLLKTKGDKKKPAAPDTSAQAPTPGPIAGITLSNPTRILYPEQGVTKQELARYYEAVAGWALPHITGRPLSVVRCPAGREKHCFFQKHLRDQLPQGMHAIPIREKDEVQDYPVIDTLSGIVGLVQMGVLEVHLWGCRENDVEHPDRIVMDLDPGPGVTWGRTVSAAFMLRDRLKHLGLESFVKTTGGKGLHVVFPFTPAAEWDEVKAFAKALADTVVAEDPDHFIATMSKAQRTNKIFIDYLRNGRGATAIAPYSTRSRENATVSTPLTWDELENGVRPENFNIRTLPQRIAALRNEPWSGISKIKQKLPKA